ncbi:amino acid ABC transporter substrate-binding protein [Carnobacterium mobile]|uniref:amino acid ABC transporter substrate-binding protein n=1 Tax=Carnobacterium mobile TaxID=2750 RepID=UPI001866595B|nr:amino acid ABC transporter substrate-binding protein [Carnobacterium mobile]
MKNKLIKTMITLGSVAMLAAGCSSNTSKADNSDKIMEKGPLVVGLDDTFAPMGYSNSSGEIVGFDVDLAKEVGKRLGIAVEFQTIDWSMKETEINAGNIDVIWNGYTISEERKEKVAFSEPYLNNSQVIIVLKNSTIQKKADLKNKTLAAQQGSSAVDAIMSDKSNIVPSLKNGEIIQYPSNNDVFNDLKSGRSDAIVVDETLGRYYMKQNTDADYRVLDEDFGEEEYAVGFRKADVKLKEAVNETLAAIKKDGTYDKIYSNWFAE